MNKKKILWFLLFAFGISWLSTGICYLAGIKYGTPVSAILTAIFSMGAPAAAAIIVQKFIYKQPIKEMGLRLREAKGKRFFRIPLFYFALCFLWIALIALLGNGFRIYGFGRITFDSAELLENINAITAAIKGPQLTKLPFPPVAFFFLQLVSSFLVGAIINTIFTLGEELGWRGFLYNETQSMGFWKSNLLIGIIWGLWHAPLILQGHNYPEHRIEGVFMMILFCIPLSYIMAYLRSSTNSVLAPAIFHATINAIAGNLMLYTKDSNDLIGSIAGLSGAMACGLIVLMIVIFDRKNLKRSY